MRRVSFIVICFATLVSACSGPRNEEHAYYVTDGPSYRVELKGQRRHMAHDPVSAIRGRTYEETLTIELPRIEGVIDGAEIPVRPGALRYTGRVVITGGRMKIDLYYDSTDVTTKVPLLWNGEYILLQKDAAGAVPRDEVFGSDMRTDWRDVLFHTKRKHRVHTRSTSSRKPYAEPRDSRQHERHNEEDQRITRRDPEEECGHDARQAEG